MNIILCGSISAAEDIVSVQKSFEAQGHTVEIPEGVKNAELRERIEVSSEEKADDKIKHDLIRGYYEKMKRCDVVVVVNPDKRGISGYIGGNTLIEMAFAHILNKKLFVLHPLPELPYTSEILATQPIVLNGDISRVTL